MFRKIAAFHKDYYTLFLTFLWVPLGIHNTADIFGTDLGFWDSLVISIAISFAFDMFLSRVFDLLDDAEITLKETK